MRRRLTRIPRACLVCATIAFVNGVTWGLIVPPFQIPDEIDHINYVQYVAEWRDLPGGAPRHPGVYSEELAVSAASVPWTIEGRPRWDPAEGRAVRRRVERDLERLPSGQGGVASSNPPLYYVLDAIAYELAAGVNFYDRVWAMRLLSALLAALTVAFAFLFVREVMPRPRWAPAVGALAIAFQPMFGYMSGGVNNDNALYACSAVLIYLVARTLRRGLTPGIGLALGLTAVLGLLAKTSFAGLLPGAAAAVLVALWRAAPEHRRRALVATAVGAATLVVLFGAWLFVSDAVFDRSPEVTTAGYTSQTVTSQTTLRGHLSYVWQAFLPALPGMQSFHSLGSTYPLWDSFFQGFVGRFGWWRFGFPMWVNWMALYLYLGVLALAGVALFRLRAALRNRWPDLVCYGLMAGGFAVLVEVAAYRYQVLSNMQFEQTRYLLPLLPFYGLLIAVAARAGGRRWGPALGALFVTLAMGHSLFAMLLVASHYYA